MFPHQITPRPIIAGLMLAFLAFPAVTAAADSDALPSHWSNAQEAQLRASVPARERTAPEPVQNFSATELVDGTATALKDKTYTTEADDLNAVLVRNRGQVAMQGVLINKSGNSTSLRESIVNGRNAAVLCANSDMLISGSTLNTSGAGSGAAVSDGDGSVIFLEHVRLITRGDSSPGLRAIGGGTVRSSDSVVATHGSNSPGLYAAKGSFAEFTRGEINTAGEDSPCLRSEGTVKAVGLRGFAQGSEFAVVEGKNLLVLENSELTGRGRYGALLYEKDSTGGTPGQASFSAKNSMLTNLSDGPMFQVSNTRAEAYLENTGLNSNSEILAKVTQGLWGYEGQSGGTFTLSCRSQRLRGDVTADRESSVTLNLGDGTVFTGAVNHDNSAYFAAVNLEKGAVWEVTGTSSVTVITDADPNLTNIHSNGHSVYYRMSACPRFEGKTFPLPGGGKLEPN